MNRETFKLDLPCFTWFAWLLACLLVCLFICVLVYFVCLRASVRYPVWSQPKWKIKRTQKYYINKYIPRNFWLLFRTLSFIRIKNHLEQFDGNNFLFLKNNLIGIRAYNTKSSSDSASLIVVSFVYNLQ